MYVIYIDEAGRGPIAGPVAVGAVVEQIEQMPGLDWFQKMAILGQKKKRGQERVAIDASLYSFFPVGDESLYQSCVDSKTLIEEERESLYEMLCLLGKIKYDTAFIDAVDIDSYGMTWALRSAIVHIVEQVTTDWSQVIVVVDGPFDFGLRKEKGAIVVPVIDGDAHVPMISAASIFAKVERDRYMIGLSKQYPMYGFAQHKGYGTKSHYKAISDYGIIEGIHRKSYVKGV